ncbi:hypothetical protein ABG067_004191 [Albugo candida]
MSPEHTCEKNRDNSACESEPSESNKSNMFSANDIENIDNVGDHPINPVESQGGLQPFISDTKQQTRKDTFTRKEVSLDSKSQVFNASWGLSFGLQSKSSGSGKKTPTHCPPLNSWFLSKGPANFVKRVQVNSKAISGWYDTGTRMEAVDTRIYNLERKQNRKRNIQALESSPHKSSFLDSLAHASWRTWFGEVDTTNILDSVDINCKFEVIEPAANYFTEVVRKTNNDNMDMDGNACKRKNRQIVTMLDEFENQLQLEKEIGKQFEHDLVRILQSGL